jgi:hypothetical protein
VRPSHHVGGGTFVGKFLSHEIPPPISLNLRVHCHAHKNLPFVSIQSHINQVHNLTSCFFKIQFNIIIISKSSQSVSWIHIMFGMYVFWTILRLLMMERH